MNIAQIMKLKGEWDKFSSNHPQFVKFLSYMASTPLEEGTIFAVSVRKKGEEREIKTNLALTKSDLEMIEILKGMAGKV